MDMFTNHYGIDWAAMALGIYDAYLMGNKKRSGFFIMAVSNLIWAGLGFTLLDSYGLAVGNIVFAAINFRGYLKWEKEHDSSSGKNNDD